MYNLTTSNLKELVERLPEPETFEKLTTGISKIARYLTQCFKKGEWERMDNSSELIPQYLDRVPESVLMKLQEDVDLEHACSDGMAIVNYELIELLERRLK
jgi:hypothetical protein